MIDSRAGSDDPTQIAQKLALRATGFDGLEAELEHLAGRWLLIVEMGEESRLYTDACGLKPAYVAADKRANHWVASHPALLASLGVVERDEELVERFESGPRFGSWPVGLIPYVGVKQVLPNHYYDLGSQEIVRYWPRKELEPLAIEDAAEQMRASLSVVLESVVERHPCITALTGGYDTRLMLACLGDRAPEIDFYSIVSEQTPYHDISIPRRLSRLKGLRFETCRAKKDELYTDALLRNVGGMFFDLSVPKVRSKAEYLGGRLALTGLVSEVSRCFFRSHETHDRSPPPEVVARCTGFRGNDVAEEAIRNWAASVPQLDTIETLDLCYWEHRVGVWAAMGLTFREAVLDEFVPLNLRSYLTASLATPVDARMGDYPLIREILRQSDPRLLEVPFNYDFRDRYLKLPAIQRRIRRLFRV